MTLKAYVLANVDPGVGYEVAKAISKIEGVKSAENVTGLYEMVIVVEVNDPATLGQVLISKIETTKGIKKTHTCVVI